MTEQESKNIKQIIEMVSEGLTKKDFIDSFKNVIDFATKIEKKHSDSLDSIKQKYSDAIVKLKGDYLKSIENLTGISDKEISKLSSFVTEKLKTLEVGRDGKDGVGIQGEPGKDGSPDTAGQVRDKLESLVGNERIDKSAIRGLETLVNEPRIQNGGIQLIGGGRGINLYVDGVKKGSIKTLNLIAGANITLTHTQASGRNDILIDAGSTGGLTVLTATGGVNSVNNTYTFTSKPIYIIQDGAWYRENKGWTWDVPTLTATMTIPPNDDIYGLK